MVIPPGYFISELARDHWPTENSALGFGISGGLWAESQVEFRNGRFEKEESFSGHSAGATLAYCLPHSGLAGVGANLSVALTKRLTLAVGYGYGIDAPRRHGFGGHDVDTQFEFKY